MHWVTFLLTTLRRLAGSIAPHNLTFLIALKSFLGNAKHPSSPPKSRCAPDLSPLLRGLLFRGAAYPLVPLSRCVVSTMDGSEVTQLGARPESAADAAYAELASHFVASVLKLAEENLAARPLTAPSRPITAAEASSAPGPAAGASQSRPNTVQSQAGASRPATSASYNPPSTAGSAADVSRPSTAVLKEVSVDAIEAALGSALKHLQQFGLVESEVPLQVEPALTLVAGIIQVSQEKKTFFS